MLAIIINDKIVIQTHIQSIVGKDAFAASCEWSQRAGDLVPSPEIVVQHEVVRRLRIEAGAIVSRADYCWCWCGRVGALTLVQCPVGP